MSCIRPMEKVDFSGRSLPTRNALTRAFANCLHAVSKNTGLYKLDKQTKDAWVAALRSGNYVQGDGFLRVEHPDATMKHCCLGVLADLADVEWVEHKSELGVYGFSSGNRWWDCFLPDSFSGLAMNEPIDQFGDGNTRALGDILVEMNDAGKSFNEIADWIEHNV